ncbi:MAG: hypothetical protein AAF346_05310 [Pseudomonadota bacterium]
MPVESLPPLLIGSHVADDAGTGRHEVLQVWINGDVQSCTLISLAELYDKEGIMTGAVEEKVNAQPNCGDGT